MGEFIGYLPTVKKIPKHRTGVELQWAAASQGAGDRVHQKLHFQTVIFKFASPLTSMANEALKGQLCCHKHLSLGCKPGCAVLALSLLKRRSTFPIPSPALCIPHHSGTGGDAHLEHSSDTWVGRKWDEYLPLPEVWRKGSISPGVTEGWGLAWSMLWQEALRFLCSLHSGNSLFSPRADIFTHLVEIPPTQTPPRDGYGKNTAELGIHPW